MKKFVAFILAMVMVFSLAVTVASAVEPLTDNCSCSGHHFFSNLRLSTNGTQYSNASGHGCGWKKDIDDERIYAYHTTAVGVSDMTNLFLPFCSNDDISCGSKWVTPGLKIPIRSDNTLVGWNYNVKARGNTDHALSGYSTIVINGYFAVN